MSVIVLDASYALSTKIPFQTKANIRVLNASEEVQSLNDGDVLSVKNLATVNCLLEADPTHKDKSRHEDKNYPVFMLVSPTGGLASTSSETFVNDVNEFLHIEEIKDIVEAGGYINVILRKFPSKNRTGSFFFRAELKEVVNADGEIVE